MAQPRIESHVIALGMDRVTRKSQLPYQKFCKSILNMLALVRTSLALRRSSQLKVDIFELSRVTQNP